MGTYLLTNRTNHTKYELAQLFPLTTLFVLQHEVHEQRWDDM